jgi:CRISPR-associated protein Cas2
VFYLVAYDIADDRRLRRVAKLMEGYGTRVQRSVFECILSRQRLALLIMEVKAQMKRREDKVQIYRLCATCRQRFARNTAGHLTGDPEVYIC